MPDVTVNEPVIKKNVPFRTFDEPAPEETPAAGAPAAAAPPAPAKAPELEQRRKDVLESMGWGEVPGAVREEAPPQAGKTAEELAAEQAAADAAAAAAEPEEVVEETPAERETRLITATVRATTEAIAPMLAPKTPAPAPAAPVTDLTPEDAKDLEVVQWLEDQQPEKYAGRAAEFAAFTRKHYAYQAEWEKNNPGKAYNSGDDEHLAFFEGNQPDIAPEVLDEARVDMRVDKAVRQRVEPKLAEQRAQEVLREAQPAIGAAVSKAVVFLMEQTSPDLAKIVMASGKPDFSDAVVTQMDEADPVAYQVLDRTARELAPVVSEMEKMAIPELGFKLNPHHPLHAKIIDEMIECEDILAKAPPEVRVRDGKQFMTSSELATAKENILKSTGSKADKDAAMANLLNSHWAMTVDDLQQTVVKKFAERAKKEIAGLNKLVEKKTKGRTVAPTGTERAAAPAFAAPAPSGVARAKPPTLGSQTDVVASPLGAKTPPKTFGETAAQVHFQ